MVTFLNWIILFESNVYPDRLSNHVMLKVIWSHVKLIKLFELHAY